MLRQLLWIILHGAEPNNPFDSGHCTIPLWSEIGIVNIDVVGPTIVYVEVLYRDDLRDKIVAAIA